MIEDKKPKLNIVTAISVADDARTRSLECAPQPPTDIDLLRQPQQILFVAQSRTFTSYHVPALVMTYTGTAPSREIFSRVESIAIQQFPGDDLTRIEVTFILQPQPDLRLAESMHTHTLETAQITLELPKDQTQIFFEEFDVAETFVWSVTTLEYVFSAIVDKLSQEMETAKIEIRQLH